MESRKAIGIGCSLFAGGDCTVEGKMGEGVVCGGADVWGVGKRGFFVEERVFREKNRKIEVKKGRWGKVEKQVKGRSFLWDS